MVDGTPLQDVYDSFQSKIDDDLTGQESLIFQFFKSALARCYKVMRHSPIYTYDNTTYDGFFDDVLENDEIELIALWMKFYKYDRRRGKLNFLEKSLGTKDFKQTDYKGELDALGISMEDLKTEIKELSQTFNTYNYQG